MFRLDQMASGGPFQSAFPESIEDLHSSESVTQGSYSRVSQMAPHVEVTATESCPLVNTFNGE